MQSRAVGADPERVKRMHPRRAEPAVNPTVLFLEAPGVLSGVRPAAAWPDEVSVRVSMDSRSGIRTTTQVAVSPTAVGEVAALARELDATVFWVSEWAGDTRLGAFIDTWPDFGLPHGTCVRPHTPKDGRGPVPEWKSIRIAQVLKLLVPQTEYVWLDPGAERWRKRLTNLVPNRGLIIKPDDIAGIRPSDLTEIRRFHGRPD